MPNRNDQQLVDETCHQTHDNPGLTELPQSVQFILPPAVGAPKMTNEEKWRDILLILNEVGVNVDILLIKSTPIGKGGAKYSTQIASLVVSVAGSDALTLERASQILDSLFPDQAATAPWIYTSHSVNVEEAIRTSVEGLREAHKAGLTPLNRAIWYRMGKTGVVERASIDLSKDPGPIRFRAVTKKKSGKTPARSRTPRQIQGTTEMSNTPEQKKLTEETAGTGESGRIPTYQSICEILREASAQPVPSTMEEIVRYSIKGFPSLQNALRAQAAAREAVRTGREEACDG